MCSDRGFARISSMNVDIPRPTTPGDISSCEFDSHADTCCLGRNFVPLYFTEEVVDVTPFTDRYDALRDVPIAGGATHVQLPDGSEYILEVHQGLWFGDQLETSLLNRTSCGQMGFMSGITHATQSIVFLFMTPNYRCAFLWRWSVLSVLLLQECQPRMSSIHCLIFL